MEEERTRLQKIVLLALAAMVMVFGSLTLVSKLHRGVLFSDTILKVEERADETVYSGKIRGREVSVFVTQESGTAVLVTSAEKGRTPDVYRVEYPLAPVQTEHGPVDGIRVTKNGRALFEGGYDSGNAPGGWYNADGQWDPGVYITFGDGGDQAEQDTPLTLDERDVLYFARGPELTARGSRMLYFLMVLASAMVALDVAFPLTMFRLQHMCDVRDPEPTDFYLAMQRMGWVVWPCLLLTGYIWALRYLP